jgi:hypothetical protein
VIKAGPARQKPANISIVALLVPWSHEWGVLGDERLSESFDIKPPASCRGWRRQGDGKGRPLGCRYTAWTSVSSLIDKQDFHYRLFLEGHWNLTHLLLSLYSQSGCGNRLAQLLHGCPWLHYGDQHDAL